MLGTKLKMLYEYLAVCGDQAALCLRIRGATEERVYDIGGSVIKLVSLMIFTVRSFQFCQRFDSGWHKPNLGSSLGND